MYKTRLKRITGILVLLVITSGCSDKGKTVESDGEKEEKVETVVNTKETEEKASKEDVTTVTVVEHSQDKENKYQEELAISFENDMEAFDGYINNVEVTLRTFMQALLVDEENVDKELLVPTILHLNDAVEYMKTMRMDEYPQMVKYQKTWQEFFEASAGVAVASVYFKNYYESGTKDLDLFMTGFESYTRATERMKVAGTYYAQEHE